MTLTILYTVKDHVLIATIHQIEETPPRNVAGLNDANPHGALVGPCPPVSRLLRFTSNKLIQPFVDTLAAASCSPQSAFFGVQRHTFEPTVVARSHGTATPTLVG